MISYQIDELTHQVIQWCNKVVGDIYPEGVHLEKYLDMPKGIPHDCDSCPIARATGTEAQVYWGYIPDVEDSEGNPILVPEFVQEWVTKFDNGEYPQYIDDGNYVI